MTTQPGADLKKSAFPKLAQLSILALILTAPFFLYPLFERPSLSQLHYIRACSLAALALLCGVYLLFPVRPLRGSGVLFLPAGIFLAALVIPAILSPTPAFCFKETLFTLGCAALSSTLLLIPSRRKETDKILLAFCFVGVVGALYGIAQNYGFEILGYSEEMKKGKLNVISVFGHPNYLAAYLAPLAPILVNYSRGGRRASGRFLALAATAVVILCLFLAGTRGAWLSLAVGLPLLFLFRARAARERIPWTKILVFTTVVVLLMVLFLACILPLLGPRYDLRERLGDVMPLLSRFYSWRMAAEMWKDHPFLGIGFGRYKVLYWDYVDDFQKRPGSDVYEYLMEYGKGVPPLNVHNEYLEIASEAGVVGLAGFVFFLAVLFRGGWRALGQRRRKNLPPGLLPGILAALGCILTDALFNFPLHQPLSALLFWILWALAGREAIAGNGRDRVG